MFVRQPEGKRNRFNLLVLSEGEHYFSDYSCVYYPPAKTEEESYKRRVKGRIKVCSKSMIFDPQDFDMPLIKFEFAQAEAIEPCRNSLIAALEGEEVFQIRANVTVELKENNNIGPYVFRKEKSLHRFSIKYVSQTTFLTEVNRLFAISRLPSYEADEKIKQIVTERESAIVFDRSWLESFDERPLLELASVKVTPLVINAGRLMITERMVYFQPLNNVEAIPVEKYPLKDILRVVQRRYALRHVGLEIFMESNSSSYFTFKNQATRDAVFDLLTTQPGMTKLQHENQAQTTFRWQCGLISNYEYLMYLNSLAHRSFNDLAQYPVFPWIIQDYSSTTLDLENPQTFRDLSKPIGALNAERLASLRKRYREMPGPEDKKFLYGTHYSTPGYVLYYLVRVAPEYMLRLQNGRFDEADRLFHSVAETWTNVLINSADLKELIPEFYCSTDFLRNSDGIQLGRRQDGTRLGNVVLPPWASDEEEFIKKHQSALESEFVSQNLHQWIDLIFGYKQRGDNAVKADNVFHPLTYEGAINIDDITDPMERMAILMQINEFGQTPHQIFTTPHPQRFPRDERERMVKSANLGSSTLSTNGSTPPSSRGGSFIGSGPPSRTNSGGSSMLSGSNIIEEAPRSILTSSFSSGLRSRGSQEDNLNQAGMMTPTRTASRTLGTPSRSLESSGFGDSFGDLLNAPSSLGESPILELSLAGLTLSSASTQTASSTSAGPATRSMVADLESDDSSVWGHAEKLKASDSFRLHRDVVTSVSLSANGQTMFSVSQDSTLKIYSLADSKQLRSISVSQLALSSCVLTGDGSSVIISSWDNNIYTYSVDYGRVNDTLTAHDDAVQCIALSETTLASGSWDSTLKTWAIRPTGIDKLPLATFVDLETEVKAVEVDVQSNLVVGGSNDGMMFLGDLRMKSSIRTWHAHDDAVVAIRTTPDGRIISCSKDGHLKVENKSGHELLSVQLAENLLCMTTNGQKLLLGGDSGQLRVWDLLQGEEVAQIAKKSKSAISCMAIPISGQTIVTGSDDGSITKWSS